MCLKNFPVHDRLLIPKSGYHLSSFQELVMNLLVVSIVLVLNLDASLRIEKDCQI